LQSTHCFLHGSKSLNEDLGSEHTVLVFHTEDVMWEYHQGLCHQQHWRQIIA